MTAKAKSPLLTESQAACLIALRHRAGSQPKTAIEAKLAQMTKLPCCLMKRSVCCRRSREIIQRTPQR